LLAAPHGALPHPAQKLVNEEKGHEQDEKGHLPTQVQLAALAEEFVEGLAGVLVLHFHFGDGSAHHWIIHVDHVRVRRAAAQSAIAVRPRRSRASAIDGSGAAQPVRQGTTHLSQPSVAVAQGQLAAKWNAAVHELAHARQVLGRLEPCLVDAIELPWAHSVCLCFKSVWADEHVGLTNSECIPGRRRQRHRSFVVALAYGTCQRTRVAINTATATAAHTIDAIAVRH
jgi:hypothetical protein